jgi:branched-chain amino acid transport system permease protein
MMKRVKLLLWPAILIGLLIYPRLFGIFYGNLFVSFAIYALFAVSFNILLGYTGLFSFGHAMYFGSGAYATALALTHIEGCPLLLALLIGLMGAVALSVILAPIVARVSGAAFSMLHLAFAMLMGVLALKLRGITGGEDGLAGFSVPPLTIPGIVSIKMTDPLNFYYFAVVVIGLSLWLLWFLTKTPFGQLMVGIRNNATRIDYMGFKVTQTKAVVYFFAAGAAGVAGAVYAMFNDLVSPDSLSILNSFTPCLMTMVGGIGSFFGPICGSAIFSFLDQVTTRYIQHVELVMGILLILVIKFFPMGFTGLFTIAKEKWLTGAPAKTSVPVASAMEEHS